MNDPPSPSSARRAFSTPAVSCPDKSQVEERWKAMKEKIVTFTLGEVLDALKVPKGLVVEVCARAHEPSHTLLKAKIELTPIERVRALAEELGLSVVDVGGGLTIGSPPKETRLESITRQGREAYHLCQELNLNPYQCGGVDNPDYLAWRYGWIREDIKRMEKAKEGRHG